MKFLLTKELGKLAKWLRILGFDSLYFREHNFSSLVILALRDGRIVLSRNQHLPQLRGVELILLSQESLSAQLREVFEKLKIWPDYSKMFTRCVICNDALVAIEKEKVKDKVPEYVFKTQERFFHCPACGRIYWQGTHWGNVIETLKGINS